MKAAAFTLLGEDCRKTDWRVHAKRLMTHYYHLVNLVIETFSGHLFSGRYKPLTVDGSGDGNLKTHCDYVHLNPSRAKLLAPEVPLRMHRWSSWAGVFESTYRLYLKRKSRRTLMIR